MFFKISALFSIFQVILAANLPNGYNSTDIQVVAANIYDDIALKNVQQKLDLLQTMNENLHLKIESLEMTLNHQELTIQQYELKKELEELKKALTSQKESNKSMDSEETNPINIGGALNQQLTILKNDLKNDLDEIRQTLTTRRESIKPLNSENISEIRDELNQHLAEMKATLTTHIESIKLSEKANLIEIRVELNQQLTLQKNELKKDLDELKASLTSQEELIKSMDSVKTNFPDNCSELNQQLIIQRNALLKDLEELKPRTIQSLPKTCSEALKKNGTNGIYKIEVPCSVLEPFNVYCLKDTVNASKTHIPGTDSTKHTSAWLVIQRRQDGSVNFYRNWTEYKHGFGNLDGEFFIGLDKLHALTKFALHELWIQLEDFEGVKRWAKYNSFAIGDEIEFYALNKLGSFEGDAGDSLSYRRGKKWSTFDRDNDENSSSCAESSRGAWWYGACQYSNLNGMYLYGVYANDLSRKGIEWHEWHGGTYSLKYVQMAIGPIPL